MARFHKNKLLFLLVGLFYELQAAKYTNLKDFGGSLQLEPYQGSRTGQCLTSDTSSLACDFSGPCGYGPAGPESKWSLVRGDIQDFNSWTESVGTSSNPGSPYIAAQFDSSSDPFAFLTSDTISCAKASTAEVDFNFWATPGVELHVCLLDSQSGNTIVCSPRYSSSSPSYPGFFRFKSPDTVDNPFKIQYMAEIPPGQQGFLILDDIGYFGSFCDDADQCGSGIRRSTTPRVTSWTTSEQSDLTSLGSTDVPATTTTTQFWQQQTTTERQIWTTPTPAPTTTTTERTTTTTAKLSIDACRVAPCNFESGTCGYSFSGNPQFSRRSGPYNGVYRYYNIRNPSGYYLGALITINSQETAVVTSQQFDPSWGKNLTFNYFRAASGLTIRICFEKGQRPTSWSNRPSDNQSKRQCSPAIAPLTGATALIWNTVSFNIPSNAYQFHFVGMSDSEPNNNGQAPIGIDDIKIDGC